MVGDIQEPVRLSFQAAFFGLLFYVPFIGFYLVIFWISNQMGEFLRSGSISFGRYETEDLCWERRSSFSNNRYLEEVERCSKPGSVTEKKAYFEAHFKRKALLSKIALECQSGADSQDRREDENMPDEDSEHSFDTFSMKEKMVQKEVKIEETGSLGCKDGLFESMTSQMLSKPGRIHEEDSATKVKTCSKMTLETFEMKAPEPSVVKAKRSESSTYSKDSVTKPVNREFRTSSTSRKERQLLDSTASMMRSVSGTLKTLVSRSSKTKVRENTSILPAKESTSKSTVNLRRSTSERVGPRAQQTVNRCMQSVSSTTPVMKQNGSALSSRNDRRAEMKKESKEKMPAKATETQQMKAKNQVISPLKKSPHLSQEKTQADLKQLRKSLSFKATPMPSFYSEARRSLDRSKDTSANHKASKIQNKPSSPLAGSFRRSLSCQSMRSQEASRNNNSKPVSKETRQPASVSQVTPAAADKALISKLLNHKEMNNGSALNNRVLENTHTSKGRKIKGVHKVGVATITKGILRSGTGSFAVSVA